MGQGGAKFWVVDIVDSVDPRQAPGRAAPKGTLFRYVPLVGDPELLLKSDDGASINWVPVNPASSAPVFVKHTYTSANFSDPGTFKTLNVGAALGANDIIESIIVHKTQDFIGGANTVAVLSMQTDVTALGSLMNNVDMYSTTPVAPEVNESNNLVIPIVTTLPDPNAGLTSHNLANIYFGAKTLQVRLDTDTANDQLTQGSVDVWVKITTLP